MNYSVILHDYQSKTSVLLTEFDDKYNSLLYIEEYINEYLKAKQGNIPLNDAIFREPSHINSYSWASYPYGYLITRDVSRSIDSYTIYNKKVNSGLIYNTNDIICLFTIQLIYNDVYPCNDLDYEYTVKDAIAITNYKAVLIELLSRHKLDETHTN